MRCGVDPDKLNDDQIMQAFRDYCLVARYDNEVLNTTIYNATMKALSNFWRAINGKSIKE